MLLKAHNALIKGELEWIFSDDDLNFNLFLTTIDHMVSEDLEYSAQNM